MGAPDSPVPQPRHPTVRVRPLELWQVGPPDSPVVYRTVTVHYLVRLLALLWLCALCPRTVTLSTDRWNRSLRWRPLLRLANRTVRCNTGQSGATPDSPVNYSGVAFPETRRWRVRVDSSWCTGQCLAGGTPDSPVRQTRAVFGWFCSFLFEPFLGLFIGLCWTFGTCRTYNLEQTS
jgi:hypothetical protein